MVDREFRLKGLRFPNRIMNASGCWCTSANELIDLARSSSGAVVSKSCTVSARAGNPLPRYYHDDIMSINSTGLANNGCGFYCDMGSLLSKVGYDKPYIVSIAPLKDGDIEFLLHQVDATPTVDAIELNLSCPNITGKSQVGYDFEAVKRLLDGVFATRSKDAKPLGVKLPAYFDKSHFTAIADVLKCYDIAFITCINSLGYGLVLSDVLDPVIAPHQGVGGVGGKSILPFGLANVFHLHGLLPHIPIIGCGGITTKKDVLRYFKAGASMVQIGTELIKQGPSVFDAILE